MIPNMKVMKVRVHLELSTRPSGWPAKIVTHCVWGVLKRAASVCMITYLPTSLEKLLLLLLLPWTSMLHTRYLELSRSSLGAGQISKRKVSKKYSG